MAESSVLGRYFTVFLLGVLSFAGAPASMSTGTYLPTWKAAQANARRRNATTTPAVQACKQT